MEHELFNLIRSADFLLVVVDLQGRPLEELDNTVALLNEHRVALAGQGGDLPQRRGTAVLPCIVLVNKTDGESWDEEFAVLRELLDGKWPLFPASAEHGRNLEELRELLFERLELMRVYSKTPGKAADQTVPFVLRKGETVEAFAAKVHKDFVHDLKTARVWGTDVHDGQQVGRDHVLFDGDIVELRV